MILSIQINKEGKLPKPAITRLQEIFLEYAGQKIDVMIEKHREKKTLNQLGYHFGVIVKAFSQKTGYTLDESHSILKVKAGFIEYVEVNGEEIPVIKSASDFTKDEMSDLINNSIHYLSDEFGIVIQSPEEYFQGE